ncbi:MAG: ABC transporter ATP-binding protein [Gammaproteobacteria bacterium]
MSKAILFSGLGHAYREETFVFRGYGAEIEQGSVCALLGPNGRGKTTLLKILLGALSPTEGVVERHGSLAFVPQLFHVSFDFTALDIVLMGRAKQVGFFSQPSTQDEIAALEMLERFGIAHLAYRTFSELSGGERQLVVFARALQTQARILVLDEPTSSLDLKNQSLILDWIAKLSHDDGLTVIFTTHSPQHAMVVADDALLMLGGTQFVFGSVDEVLTEENLQALYSVPLKRLQFVHLGAPAEAIAPCFPRRRRVSRR